MVKVRSLPELTELTDTEPDGSMAPLAPADGVMANASTAKVAVTVMSAVTFVSVLGLIVLPSLHLTKWKPELGTAITEAPLAPWFTVCEVAPVMTPPAVQA